MGKGYGSSFGCVICNGVYHTLVALLPPQNLMHILWLVLIHVYNIHRWCISHFCLISANAFAALVAMHPPF